MKRWNFLWRQNPGLSYKIRYALKFWIKHILSAHLNIALHKSKQIIDILSLPKIKEKSLNSVCKQNPQSLIVKKAKKSLQLYQIKNIKISEYKRSFFFFFILITFKLIIISCFKLLEHHKKFMPFLLKKREEFKNVEHAWLKKWTRNIKAVKEFFSSYEYCCCCWRIIVKYS